MNASVFEYNDDNYYIKQILNLFCFSYDELKKVKENNPYSRKIIHDDIIKIKGPKAKLELEDYLRNDLVNSYVNKNKAIFNIDNYKFLTGIEEIKGNVSTGNLDVKVLLPTSSMIDEEAYFVFECKRVNKLKAKKQYYITGGIERFTTRKYYPIHNAKIGVMLAFAEMKKNIEKEELVDIANSINQLIDDKVYKVKELSSCDLKYNNSILGARLFDSIFKRDDNSNIILIHLFLDYYDIVKN